MSPRNILRNPILSSICFKPSRPQFRPQSKNTYTTNSRTRQRINTLHSKFPKFLHPYTRGLLNAPISHLISFLILHEITAIVPLVGLASLFHYTNWLPEVWVEGKWVSEGVNRFGNYFGKKGWFGFSRTEKGELVGGGEGEGSVVVEGQGERRWRVGEQGSRVLVEVATAYAITKVFLPARILCSVWATPWFARVFVGRFAGLFRGVKGGSVSTGLGGSAGGVGGGVGKVVVDTGKKIPP